MEVYLTETSYEKCEKYGCLQNVDPKTGTLAVLQVQMW